VSIYFDRFKILKHR